MAKKVSEDDFVNEGLSEDEVTAISEAEASNETETEAETTPEAEAGVLDAGKTQEQANQQQPEAEKPQMVDVRALQEARAESRELKERYRLLEERTNSILGILGNKGQQEEQKEAPPDPDQDIFAALKYEREKREALEQKIAAEANERAKLNEQTQQDQQVWSYWEQDSARYGTENPDFGNAAKWIAEYRDKQLQAMAVVQPEMTSKAARDRQIDMELKQLIIGAAQSQRSPAEIVYELAKGYGYTPQAAQQVAAQVQQQAGPEAIQAMQEKQDKHRSLSEASGGEPPAKLDAKALASMSEAAFRKLLADPAKAKEVDEIMGIG